MYAMRFLIHVEGTRDSEASVASSSSLDLSRAMYLLGTYLPDHKLVRVCIRR